MSNLDKIKKLIEKVEQLKHDINYTIIEEDENYYLITNTLNTEVESNLYNILDQLNLLVDNIGK